jgi:hypothetical protein
MRRAGGVCSFTGVLALAAAALTACGGGGSTAATTPRQASVDEATAEKDAKSLVVEIYQTLSRSTNTDSLMALLAEPLVVFGPRRTDAHASRTDALVAMREIIDARGKKTPVSSGSLSVVAAPGGLSAWAVDVVKVEGEPMAMTAVLTNDDDFWRVVAAALATTPSAKTVRSSLAKDAVVPPGMPGFGKVSGDASGAVATFKRGLSDPDVWGDDLAKRTDAVFVGPSAGTITRGKKAIAALWKKRGKAHIRYASAGEIAASTTPDGKLAWVTAPVVQFSDDDDPLPLRLFGIFERTSSGWTLVALQEALALDEPGVGANFRKVTPPPIKAEAPPPPKAEDTPPPTKTKKKKKKKKKRTDDDE